ncbi:hypothetical protein D0Z07_6837 [Hyphodiscus hymeniophilus]|uniref:Vacuolar ATPase assembly protein VMA22 n=1 Tax=Hyphodiscus hymeniophilus TaxID=353542 RepID=A0A9P6VGZ8_9HELO|nr:hypothetical protein D0Z07_6837 [Hyphodiscus hymeniophilus]
MSPTATSATLSEEIDQLLEHYLSLLDQYTTLRSQLSSIQSSLFQNISRANFSAERGVRYGADFYDARMQATRVCHVTVPATDLPTTDVLAPQENVVEGKTLDGVQRGTTAEAGSLKEKERQNNPSTIATAAGTACFAIGAVINSRPSTKTEHAAADKGDANIAKGGKDPLHMFGFLTPSALREAQRDSVKTVVEVLPRIASVDAEMKEVEIRIRRARKWKARAETKEGNLTEKSISTGHRVEVEV